MAIQSDETLVTKGDLKTLYTDKILPYLGGNMMMQTGVSDYYSTDEKVIGIWTNGKPIYQKVINFGAGPTSNTTKQVSHNVALEHCVNAWATGDYGVHSSPIPYISRNLDIIATLNVTTTTVDIGSNVDLSSYIINVVLQYTKTTDTASSALTTPGCYDLNRPDLWPANKEIFFGNGLYGMRLTAAINSTLNANGGQFSVEFPITGYKKMVSHGGYIDCGSLNYHIAVPTSWGGNIAWDASIWFNTNSSKLIFAIMNNSTSARTITNGNYDVWVTYIK